MRIVERTRAQQVGWVGKGAKPGTKGKNRHLANKKKTRTRGWERKGDERLFSKSLSIELD